MTGFGPEYGDVADDWMKNRNDLVHERLKLRRRLISDLKGRDQRRDENEMKTT